MISGFFTFSRSGDVRVLVPHFEARAKLGALAAPLSRRRGTQRSQLRRAGVRRRSKQDYLLQRGYERGEYHRGSTSNVLNFFFSLSIFLPFLFLFHFDFHLNFL